MPERFSGPYARDAHRQGLGDDYARDGSGDRIREEVCAALTDDSGVDALRIAACDDEVEIGKASE